MTSKEFVKINNIFNCRLTLEDGTEFTIPTRSDGYIYATKLCHVGGKELSNWLRLQEVKKLILKIQDKLDKELWICDSEDPQKQGIKQSKSENEDPQKSAIEIIRGNVSKYQQGTWIHLAQWISTEFSLQVSKWVRELILTDEVRLGQEKS